MAKKLKLHRQRPDYVNCQGPKKIGYLGWRNKEEFCQYLESTLIPDLLASGHQDMAEDFATAIFFTRQNER